MWIRRRPSEECQPKRKEKKKRKRVDDQKPIPAKKRDSFYLLLLMGTGGLEQQKGIKAINPSAAVELRRQIPKEILDLLD